MSLNSFFDTLDTEAQFDAWRSNIRQKLIHLKNTLPIENREELLFVGETLQFLDNLTFKSSDYMANSAYSSDENKQHLIERLKKCNSFYKKLGKH